jgi:hypothetical protein
MRSLALPREPYDPFSPTRERVDGTQWRLTGGALPLGDRMRLFMSGGEPPAAISGFLLNFSEDACTVTFRRGADSLELTAATDGTRRRNSFDGSQALVSAAWTSEDTLQLTLRIIEGCFMQRLAFQFHGTGCTIQPIGTGLFGMPAGEPATAAQV